MRAYRYVVNSYRIRRSYAQGPNMAEGSPMRKIQGFTGLAVFCDVFCLATGGDGEAAPGGGGGAYGKWKALLDR